MSHTRGRRPPRRATASVHAVRWGDTGVGRVGSGHARRTLAAAVQTWPSEKIPGTRPRRAGLRAASTVPSSPRAAADTAPSVSAPHGTGPGVQTRSHGRQTGETWNRRMHQTPGTGVTFSTATSPHRGSRRSRLPHRPHRGSSALFHRADVSSREPLTGDSLTEKER